MRFRLVVWACIALFFSPAGLPGRALAQPGEPRLAELSDHDLLAAITAALKANDLGKVGDIVASNPKVSGNAFEAFLTIYNQHSDAESKQTAGLVLNILARAFQVRLGNDSYARQLQQLGILAPAESWKGTPFEGGMAGPVTSPAGGQASADQVFEQLRAALAASDLKKAADVVQANAAGSEALFKMLVEYSSQQTDPQEKAAAGLIMNIVARAFQVRMGNRQYVQQLQQMGILVPEDQWNGTPLASGSQPSTPSAPSTPSSPVASGGGEQDLEVLMKRMQDVQKEMETIKGLDSFCGIGLQNRHAFLALLEFEIKLSDEAGEVADQMIQSASKLVDQLQQMGMGAQAEQMRANLKSLQESSDSMKSFGQLREALQYNAVGNRLGAVQALDKMRVNVKSSQPDWAVSLSAAILSIALHYDLIEVAERQLKEYQPTDPGGRAQRESVEMALAYKTDSSLSISRFVATHDRVWPVLVGMSKKDQNNLQQWALGWWPAAAGELSYRLAADDPEGRAVREILQRDLAQLHEQASREWAAEPLSGGKMNPSWSAVMYTEELDLYLTLAGQAREVGALEDCQGYLAKVEQALPELERARTRLRPVVDTLLTPRGIPFDMNQTVLSRIPGSYNEERARLIEARNQGEPTPESRDLMKKALGLYEAAHAYNEILHLLPDFTVAFLKTGGSPEAALQAVDGALKDSQRLQNRDGEIRARLARGRILAARGDKAGAIKELTQGTKLLEAWVTEMGGNAPAAEKLRRPARSSYQLLAQLQAEQGKPQEAFSVLGSLQQLDAFNQSLPTGKSGQLGQDLKQLEATRRSLRSLEDQQVALASLPDGDNKVAGQMKETQTLLASTRGQFYNLVGKIGREHPEYESMLAVRPRNFTDYQPSIPPDAAVVQFLPAEDQVIFFVATRESLKIRSIPTGKGELEKLVRDYRLEITRKSRSGDPGPMDWKAAENAPLAKVLGRLHQILVDPVEEDIKDKKVVAFIPTGPLFYLPLQSMARARPDGGMEFLIERKEVVVLAKSSDLDRLGRPAANSRGKLVAFGNPDGSLPGASQEVKAIGQIYAGSTVLTESQATKDKLVALAPQQDLGFLHLATHGILNSRDPGLSYLVLAGGEDKGRMTVSEIADLKLGQGTRLITLSACQTALGESHPGSEVMSLADAFRWAGSPALMASLWKVSDEATRELMVEFYGQLKTGSNPALALQAAQVKLIKDGKYGHPFFWAPFVLVGDWR